VSSQRQSHDSSTHRLGLFRLRQERKIIATVGNGHVELMGVDHAADLVAR